MPRTRVATTGTVAPFLIPSLTSGYSLMWIVTQVGFFEVCSYRGERQAELVSISAPLRSQLIALQGQFHQWIGAAPIQAVTDGPFAFRLVVTRSVWEIISAELTGSIDYEDFQTAAARQQGLRGTAYTEALQEVSHIMQRLQATEGLPSISVQQIHSLMPYHKRFAAKDFSVGSWRLTEVERPYFEYSPLVHEFIQMLYDHGWVTFAFPWADWQTQAQEYVDSPNKLENADAKTILKLFSTHVRADQVCEGYLATLFDNGHIVALLDRLEQILHDWQGAHPTLGQIVWSVDTGSKFNIS